MLDIIQLPVLNDNYIYLIHEPDSGQTAVIDPAVSQPVLECLKKNNWTLNFIFNTHHHHDHVGANQELKQQTNCQVFASEFDQSRTPGIDKTLNHGDELNLGKETAKIIATPGHTLGHIIFHFPESNALFCGDTLFSMGCGRLFEGTAEQMWQSLQQIKQLPKHTKIYCAHEYTLANSQFAISLEPDNLQLQKRIQKVKELRSQNQSTIPSSLEQELATNPFLRENSEELRKKLNMPDSKAVDVFAKIRVLKDGF